MKTDSGHPKTRHYLEDLAASSPYTFTTGEARTALGLSPPALKVALNRLAHQRLIVSPVRGFHVIVPPEYRSLGSLPADQFVPALMTTLKLPYYVGLLTAAEYHVPRISAPRNSRFSSRRPGAVSNAAKSVSGSSSARTCAECRRRP